MAKYTYQGRDVDEMSREELLRTLKLAIDEILELSLEIKNIAGAYMNFKNNGSE